MATIPALGRLRQEDGQFMDRLGYIVSKQTNKQKRMRVK
jgi:hypothetical protein